MRTSRWNLSALVAGLLAATAYGGETSYVCQVAQVYSLDDAGNLRPQATLAKVTKENTFTVSRTSGQLFGKSLSLDTTRAKETKVLNRGSKENSFKATADFGDFPNGTRPFQLIEVQEFHAGPSKPFIIFGELGLITGTCK